MCNLTKVYSMIYGNYGVFLAKYPWVAILIPIILLASSAYGMTIYPDAAFEDQNKAFTPRNKPAIRDSDIIADKFPASVRPFVVYLTDVEEDNMVTFSHFAEVKSIIDDIAAFQAKDGAKVTDYCILNGAKCLFDSTNPLFYYYNFGTSEYEFNDSNDASVLATVNNGVNKFVFSSIATDEVFSATKPETLTYSGGSWDLNKAIGATYKILLNIPSDLKGVEALNAFEEELYNHLVEKNNDLSYIKLNFLSFPVLISAFESSILGDLGFFGIATFLLIVYSFFVMGDFDRVHSRMQLTVVAVLTIIISVVEMLAISSWLGFKTAGPHNLLNFLILGIGFDDIYVIVRGADNAAKEEGADLETIMRHTFEHNGLSVTISSFTNIIGFASGYFSSMDVIRSFSVYAAIGIFCLFFNVFTLFGASLSYDLARIKNNDSDCCGATCCLPESAERTDNLPIIFSWFYENVIKTVPANITALLLMISLIAFGVYGLTHIEVYFSLELFIVESSPVYKDLQMAELYFAGDGTTINFYQYDFNDFHKARYQTQMIEFEVALKADKYYSKNAQIWYSDLHDWVDAGNCNNGGVVALDSDSLIPEDDFYPCLVQLKSYPNSPQSMNNVTMNSSDSAIKTATMSAVVKKVTGNEAIEMMDDVRLVAAIAPGNCFAFEADFFTLETNKVIVREFASILGGCFLSILLVLLLVFNDIVATLMVIVDVGCVVLIVTGSLYWWGYDLNTVTMIHLYMSVGVSVDYCAHIMHEYKSQQGERVDRVGRSYAAMAPAVTHAIVSTLLAVVLTGFSESYIFKTFFSLWLCIVLVGAVFAIFILPTFLIYIGPNPDEQDDNYQLENEDKSPGNKIDIDASQEKIEFKGDLPKINNNEKSKKSSDNDSNTEEIMVNEGNQTKSHAYVIKNESIENTPKLRAYVDDDVIFD